jgi:hypothetical protein
MLEYFRRFLSVLPDRSGYCLNCLSRLYGEPVGVIRDLSLLISRPSQLLAFHGPIRY